MGFFSKLKDVVTGNNSIEDIPEVGKSVGDI